MVWDCLHLKIVYLRKYVKNMNVENEMKKKIFLLKYNRYWVQFKQCEAKLSEKKSKNVHNKTLSNP